MKDIEFIRMKLSELEKKISSRQLSEQERKIWKDKFSIIKDMVFDAIEIIEK